MIPEVSRDKVTKASQALNRISQVEEWLEVAKACKLDCSDEDARCQEMKTFLMNYLELFGSQHPNRRS